MPWLGCSATVSWIALARGWGCRHAIQGRPQVLSDATCIGLDVHARSVRAAAIDPLSGVIREAALGGGDGEVLDFIARVGDARGVRVAYEAGPTGFHLARTLEGEGIECVVAAPSKLLRASGDRIKTDRRDAFHLAQMLAAGQVVGVRVPTVEEESARDLVRARDDVRRELMAARHRLSKLLLRRGFLYEGKTTWGVAHRAWLGTIRREGLGGAGWATLQTFDESWEMVCALEARRGRLDEGIARLAEESSFAEGVKRLSCLRGISTLTAVGLAVEVGDWQRFTPTSIGSYLGLVPSEHSSGSTRHQGGLTRTGNAHARRLLVEAAWHHLPTYHPSAALQARWDKAPRAVADHAGRGNRRLHKRWLGFKARKKTPTVANCAIARELAGWCQVLVTMDA